MSCLLDKFVSASEFDSYEDFKENFKIVAPEKFNFAYDVVDVYAEHQPGKRAMVWCDDHGGEKEFSFSELREWSNKAANAFVKAGVKNGDHVMLILKSRYEFWFCLLGLHRIGAVAVPATHMLKTRDIKYRIENANIKMVVCVNSETLCEHVDKSESQCSDILKVKAVVGGQRSGWVDFNKDIEEASNNFPRPQGEEAVSNDDISLLYFSSGTVGYPKMVQHNFAYPLGHILTAKYWQNVIDDGLHYTVADSGWAKCVWGKIYGQWICGSAVFVYDYDKFDAANMMKKAVKYNVTTFCAPPTIYRFMVKADMSQYDFSSLKYCVVAGEPLNPEIYGKFHEHTGLKLMEGFGQTETLATIANYPWMTPKPGSMGKPSPGFDIDLINIEGEICDVGEEGEIIIDTSGGVPLGLFSGYYNHPEKTKEVWDNNIYHTGDMAWRDEDGYYWFVGRTDDIIKSSGYKIGPFEVESALIQHAAVLECAITGASHPVRGQVVKATIVLSKDYKASDDLKVELQEHVKNVTAPYKYPRIIEFVDELPKTISGKIRRVQIRKKDSK
jgi:acetyl-CoA synthetase